MNIHFYRGSKLSADDVLDSLADFRDKNPRIVLKLEFFSFKDIFWSLTRKAYLLDLYTKYFTKSSHSPGCLIKAFDGGDLIGVICVTLGNERFSFMAENDKQFGNVAVLQKYRGRNIAFGMMLYGLDKIYAENYWYLVAESNHVSVRVAEKSGFSLVGYGCKVQKDGSMLGLGKYVLTTLEC
ncbi:GNAT family N-acetyltransferase [Pseudomonadales bacterium]|nr:GNAT family N-acetyltransferase [Pseudomonadales bacterium]